MIKFAWLTSFKKDRLHPFKVNNEKMLLELGMSPEIAKALFHLDKDSKEELVRSHLGNWRQCKHLNGRDQSKLK